MYFSVIPPLEGKAKSSSASLPVDSQRLSWKGIKHFFCIVILWKGDIMWTFTWLPLALRSVFVYDIVLLHIVFSWSSFLSKKRDSVIHILFVIPKNEPLAFFRFYAKHLICNKQCNIHNNSMNYVLIWFSFEDEKLRSWKDKFNKDHRKSKWQREATNSEISTLNFTDQPATELSFLYLFLTIHRKNNLLYVSYN